MRLKELTTLFDASKRRYHLVGTEQAGIVAGLDLEGRLFAVIAGEVINRVNPEAFTGRATRAAFLNPGGDGLWPAPEGTMFGYEYPTGVWRVPPGLTGADYRVVEESKNAAVIAAEIDLINARQLGVPCEFRRAISVVAGKNAVTATVVESITYLGARTLSRGECLLAPWSLCQFDSGPGREVVFPEVPADAVWDLYGPSDDQRFIKDGLWHTRTDGAKKYQIAMDKRVEWIEYRDPERGLTVHRSAKPLAADRGYIDIIDAPPTEKPSNKGIRYSVYSDPSRFMEIEACGGAPAREYVPGDTLSVEIVTEYKLA